jgi:hypothetical protein
MNNKLHEVDLTVYKLYVGALLSEINEIQTLKGQLRRFELAEEDLSSAPN